MTADFKRLWAVVLNSIHFSTSPHVFISTVSVNQLIFYISFGSKDEQASERIIKRKKEVTQFRCCKKP